MSRTLHARSSRKIVCLLVERGSRIFELVGCRPTGGIRFGCRLTAQLLRLFLRDSGGAGKLFPRLVHCRAHITRYHLVHSLVPQADCVILSGVRRPGRPESPFVNGRWLYSGSAQKQADDEDRQKDVEEHLGDSSGSDRNPAESEDRGDDGNNQKNPSVVKHVCSTSMLL
jgi:hypothetical protein